MSRAQRSKQASVCRALLFSFSSTSIRLLFGFSSASLRSLNPFAILRSSFVLQETLIDTPELHRLQVFIWSQFACRKGVASTRCRVYKVAHSRDSLGVSKECPITRLVRKVPWRLIGSSLDVHRRLIGLQ